MVTTQELCKLFWTIPENNAQLSISCNLHPSQKTIQVRWTRCGTQPKKQGWNHNLLWTPIHGCASVGWPARNYLHQLSVDEGCNLEDLLGVMDDREGGQERVKEIYAVGMTRWWILKIKRRFYILGCIKKNLFLTNIYIVFVFTQTL